jgi:hypothetical protein
LNLRGTKTEQDFREELIASRNSLFHDTGKRKFLEILFKQFTDMKTAYVLDWIPDQDEALYSILIDDKIIVRINLDRYTLEMVGKGKLIPLREYQKGLSKIRQIQLAVAMELAQKDLIDN